ncbi:MAG: hypothetical protein ABFS17_02815 [Chloroflexota bacterium]
MKMLSVIILVFTGLLVGCGGEPEPISIAIDPTPIEEAVEVPAVEVLTEEPEVTISAAAERLLVDLEVALPDLHQDRTALVAASGNCLACHSGLSDTDGNDISFDSKWRSSMHAFAAIDPYWQASVSAEVVENPELSEVIENKCATCHMPLAHFDANANGETAAMFEDGFLNAENPLHDLAMDAVSCTGCHQIMADNLGTLASFSGGFLIDSDNTIYGERMIYGPFPIGRQPANVMAQASGFLAEQSAHMTDSALCATCHTLYTPYLNAVGEVAGEFPEQMAYFEWVNSSYVETQTCQDCHMPAVSGNVIISTVMGQPKEYLRLHSFTGANTFMLNLVGDNPEILGSRAKDGQIETAVAATELMLQTQTATVEVLNMGVTDGQLGLDVVVTSMTGHKFPTGFPSRRAWLQLTVRDGEGNLIFESGASRPDGLIIGNDNDLDESMYEPHYSVISSPDEVQIYETILLNTDGQVTTTLLYGAGYAKDNRLLPAGFELTAVIPETATHGLAAEDLDFISGGDTVRYQVDVSEASGPFTVSVALNYQSIGFRWAENLRGYGTEQTDKFIGLYDGAVNLPVQVSSVEVDIEE